MKKINRFGISMEDSLLRQFDKLISQKGIGKKPLQPTARLFQKYCLASLTTYYLQSLYLSSAYFSFRLKSRTQRTALVENNNNAGTGLVEIRSTHPFTGMAIIIN